MGAAGFPLVQFRGKPLDSHRQWLELATALRESQAQGGWPFICINDRADLAVLAVHEGLKPWGLHLGQGDLPPATAKGLPGLGDLHLGSSTHHPLEWASPDPACDHAGIGPFRATASKGDHAEPIGLEGLARACPALQACGVAPVAIGGLTRADFRDCFGAGAQALAMVGEVARAADPGELLWEAQVQRWQVNRPLARGRGLVLIGGSGAGKSSLALCLARRLALPALDSDTRVAATAARSIPQIFQEGGEAHFRSLERAAILACLQVPAVVSLGAGAWEDASTRDAVQAAGFQTLWLAEVPERAWTRVAGDPQRPLAGSREDFMARWAQRSGAWSRSPMVLPLGRTAEVLATALVP